jgi:hypothetical protein
MEKVELIISKDRVPFIVEELGVSKVTVSEYNEYSDMLSFELTSPLEILSMFHAGIRCGMRAMSIVHENN